jgi:hypothetical protein
MGACDTSQGLSLGHGRMRHVPGKPPGANRRTGKTFTVRVVWTLQLGAATYRFGSDPRLSGRLVVS